jgi:hypothetical protein
MNCLERNSNRTVFVPEEQFSNCDYVVLKDNKPYVSYLVKIAQTNLSIENFDDNKKELSAGYTPAEVSKWTTGIVLLPINPMRKRWTLSDNKHSCAVLVTTVSGQKIKLSRRLSVVLARMFSENIL